MYIVGFVVFMVAIRMRIYSMHGKAVILMEQMNCAAMTLLDRLAEQKETNIITNNICDIINIMD